MIVFVLSGGNTKGSIQAGAIVEFAKRGVYPDLIVGNSIGAVNGYLYHHVGAEGVLKAWKEVKKRSQFLRLNWRNLFWDGIYDVEPLKKFLLKRRSAGNNAITSVSTFVDLEMGSVEYVSTDSGEYHLEATLASASEPVLMRPRNNKVDGGVREIIPLSYVTKNLDLSKVEKIYIIATNPIVENPKRKKPKKNLLSIVDRTAEILLHEIYLNDIVNYYFDGFTEGNLKDNLFLISPEEREVERMDFNEASIAKGLELGAKLVKRHFGE